MPGPIIGGKIRKTATKLRLSRGLHIPLSLQGHGALLVVLVAVQKGERGVEAAVHRQLRLEVRAAVPLARHAAEIPEINNRYWKLELWSTSMDLVTASDCNRIARTQQQVMNMGTLGTVRHTARRGACGATKLENK